MRFFKNIILCFVLFCALSGKGQNTFSRLIDKGAGINLFKSDSTYYSFGIKLDSIYNWFEVINVIKMKENDSIYESKTVENLNSYYGIAASKVVFYNHHFYVPIFQELYTDSFLGVFTFMKFDLNGELVYEKNFAGDSPYYERGLHDLVIKNDTLFFVGTERTGENESKTILIKSDTLGNEYSRKRFGTGNEIIRRIELTNDNGFVLSGKRKILYWNNSYKSNALVYKMNQHLQFEWTYLSSHDTIDDSKVIQGNDGNYYGIAKYSIYDITFHSIYHLYTFSLNTNGSFRWGNKMWNWYARNSYSNLRFDSDSTFVTCGGASSSILNNQAYDHGILSKFKSNGDTLWHRKISHHGPNDEHYNYIYDFLIEDSTFTLLGTVYSNRVADTIGQKVWFAKADKYGCIVPGCHIPDTTNTVNGIIGVASENTVKLYPNPVSDYLNLFVGNFKGKQINIEIIDTKGILLDKLSFSSSQTTYIVPFQQYSSGLYLLRIFEDNQFITTKKLIKN